MEEIKFDVIERVCEKQNFRELLLHIIKNSSGNRIKKMLEDIENNNKIDKKMKIKVDENLFSAIISVMTKVSRREFVAPFFVSLIIFW